MKNTFLVLDTETADLTGSVYDLGYVICNKRGETIVERNWLVEEIFTDAKTMMGAFYAGKLFTHYAGMLCLLYTSPSPRDGEESRMPSSA